MVKQMSHSDPDRYTEPELRDKIKSEVTAGDKGGKPGQWSARKAQLVTHEYEAAGGGYKKEQGVGQKSLKQWGDEKWRTDDGEKADREGGTARYLPDKAWNELSEEERKATDKKKQRGSRAGKQFVSHTKAASSARKKASGTGAASSSAKAEKPAPKKKTAAKKQSAAPGKESAAKKAAAQGTNKTSATKKTTSKGSPAKKSPAAKKASKITPASKKTPRKTSTAKSPAKKRS